MLDTNNAQKLYDTMLAYIGGSYDGANNNSNTLRSLDTTLLDPNADMEYDREQLIANSRAMTRNNPYANGVIGTLKTLVFGDGVKYNPRVDAKALGIKEEACDELERKMKFEFNLWADSKFSDSTLAMTFNEGAELTYGSSLMSGDAFVIPQYIKNNPRSKIALRYLEADMCGTPFEKSIDDNIFHGVETDSKGRLKAYHFYKKHPGGIALDTEHTSVQAYNKLGLPNVLHILDRQRQGQKRGVPYLTASLETFQNIHKYMKATIAGRIVSSLFGVFITSDKGYAGISDPNSRTKTELNVDEKTEIAMKEGMATNLKPGEKIELADPRPPSEDYEQFLRSNYKIVSANTRIPMSLVLLSFDSNYSASRGEILEAWRWVRRERARLISQMFTPILEIFFYEAVEAKRIDLPGFIDDLEKRKAYLGAFWAAREAGQLDPLKESKALEIQEDRNWTTGEDIAINLYNGDYLRNVEQRKKENKAMSISESETDIKKEIKALIRKEIDDMTLLLDREEN